MIFSRIKAAYFAVEFLISILLVVFFMWLFKKHIHGVRRFWVGASGFLAFIRSKSSATLTSGRI